MDQDVKAPHRITLERPRPEHQERFLAAAAASRGLHRPWYAAPSTPAEFQAYVHRCASETHEGFLIFDAAGELAGTATLGNIVRRNFQSANLGYAAFAPHQGRGVMAAGLAAVLDEAFGALALHRVEAGVQPANRDSGALLRRLGFRIEGHSPRYLIVDGDWRDHDRWAILGDEWRARRQAG